MLTLHKYPRTHHLEGSRLQPGHEDTSSVPFDALAGRFLVVEEKLDGANAGIRFDADGKLWLQSRGHYLTGGVREKHFNLFKQWAHAHADALRRVLGSRYILYGESRDLAREFLRDGQSFVWNATNLSRQLRGQCIRLFADYQAKVRIVYLEVPEERLHRQNRQRPAPVPRAVIERLLDRWEVPDQTEAHQVEWKTGGD